MPNTLRKKERIIALRELLLKRTDENNPLTADEIMRELSTDRRTLEDDIETLNNAGMDIERISRPNLSFAVISRDFEMEELKLLLDCVQVSKFLSQKKTDELTEKLCNLCSENQAKELQGQIYRNHIKSGNESIYNSIYTIREALSNGKSKMLSFQYIKLPTKLNEGKQHLVFPFCLVYAEENYYLIAHEILMETRPQLETIKHFRVDRMKKVDIVDSEQLERQLRQSYFYSRHLLTKIDMNNYTKQNFSMYGGKVEQVTMRFPEHMIGVVFDRFGTDTQIKQKSGGYFEITENIAVSPQFYGWIFGLGKDVKIIEPASVAQGMKDLLKDTYENYTLKRNRKKSTESS